MDISDLSRIHGFWKFVGMVGLLIMMGGLAAFAFGLLSEFAAVNEGQIPRGFPPIAIYGFRIAAVGGILTTIAVAAGKKDPEVDIQIGHRGGANSTFDGSPITVGDNNYVSNRTVINRQRTYINQIQGAVRHLPPGQAKRDAEAALGDVRRAVDKQRPVAIANALGRLTAILRDAGALAVAGNAAARGIVDLAGTLARAGTDLVEWFARSHPV